jgi:hypothetical protein
MYLEWSPLRGYRLLAQNMADVTENDKHSSLLRYKIENDSTLRVRLQSSSLGYQN